jgi:hypothetical protein
LNTFKVNGGEGVIMNWRYFWPASRPERIPWLLSVVLGGFSGLLIRLTILVPKLMLLPLVMTSAFLLLGPFAIGYITVNVEEKDAPQGFLHWIFLPWPAVLLCASLTYLLNLEGLICIVFALPIMLVFASLGGLAAGLLARRQRRGRGLQMACVALIPLLLAPLETHMDSPVQYRTVETQIRIHATESTVWSNIERVRPISPSELPQTWAHAIGFPRPVEATLSFEGPGGVRHASFEHGLLFIETVTRWEPNRLLAFSIKADTAHIPKTTLDEHVTIGGRYFDVLDGEYRIERLQEGDMILHLSSQERLSTDFNGYAGLWSDAVMKTLQKSILEVVKNRSEASTR